LKKQSTHLATPLGRQVDRQAFGTEGLAQLLDQQFEIDVGMVDLVDRRSIGTGRRAFA
jgi:phage baseplate assembly protein W